MADYYKGKHTGEPGPQPVTKNDKPLNPAPSQRIWNHSPDGFNWGYQGSSPAQLALALLYDVTKDKDIASRLHQDFKREIVASWGNTWGITDAHIREWVNSRLVQAKGGD